jgi:hypothetical protein
MQKAPLQKRWEKEIPHANTPLPLGKTLFLPEKAPSPPLKKGRNRNSFQPILTRHSAHIAKQNSPFCLF